VGPPQSSPWPPLRPQAMRRPRATRG
jgi:hypothetical protein